MYFVTTQELIQKAYSIDLEGVHILDKYSVEEIRKIYNGIGPDRFLAIIRKALNKLHPTLLVVALIHDLEYHEGGTREQRIKQWKEKHENERNNN